MFYQWINPKSKQFGTNRLFKKEPKEPKRAREGQGELERPGREREREGARESQREDQIGGTLCKAPKRHFPSMD